MAQNSYDLAGSRGLSDFDARHRFVISAIYELPFRGNRLVDGWQLAAIVQSQSGNPVNIVTTNSTVNGVAGTLRPDVNGPINILGSVDAWFDTSVFTPVARFGNLGRNVVIGPSLQQHGFFDHQEHEIRREIAPAIARRDSSTFLIMRTLGSPAM